MGRWHHMYDIPFFLRCSGCDNQIRVSEREHTHVRMGLSDSGWKCTEEHKILCPTCAENGIPSDVVTLEKIGELVKKQWNMTYVRPISRRNDVFYFAAGGFGKLRPLSIIVTHDTEHDVYRVTLLDGVSRDLGELNVAS